jgi:hypothetical protein
MVAGTRARAQHVNTNFDNFRGHLIPINADTATASDATHDLGSSEHRWRSIYLSNSPFINGVQSGSFPIEQVMDASLPTDIVENNSWLDIISFPKSRETGVIFKFIVPQEYTPGNRISIRLNGYGETTPSHFAMELGSALYKSSVTSMSATAPANALTSSSNINPTLSGVFFTNTSLRITDASGLINGVTVTGGDIIACYLKRRGDLTADTNTGYYFLTNMQVDLNN